MAIDQESLEVRLTCFEIRLQILEQENKELRKRLADRKLTIRRYTRRFQDDISAVTLLCEKVWNKVDRLTQWDEEAETASSVPMGGQ